MAADGFRGSLRRLDAWVLKTPNSSEERRVFVVLRSGSAVADADLECARSLVRTSRVRLRVLRGLRLVIVLAAVVEILAVVGAAATGEGVGGLVVLTAITAVILALALVGFSGQLREVEKTSGRVDVLPY